MLRDCALGVRWTARKLAALCLCIAATQWPVSPLHAAPDPPSLPPLELTQGPEDKLKISIDPVVAEFPRTLVCGEAGDPLVVYG